MLRFLDTLFGSRPRWWLLSVCLAGVAAIAVADAAAGPEWGLAVFSLAPVVVCAWYGSGRTAAVVVVAAAVGWLLHAPGADAAPLRALWNATAKLIYFGVSARLVVEVRRHLRLEESMADTDMLTGLLNRRAFWEAAEQERSRIKRYGGAATVAYIDLDNFKSVNDERGHAEGDRLLVEVASVLEGRLRANDLVARLGGDEFAVWLIESDAERARVASNCVRPFDRTAGRSPRASGP